MAGYQKRKHDQSEYSISDQACTRCRERKIRCGRELPQCNNCERDDSATCIYQNPTKRVNHLKSLFDSVNRLNERLEGIESQLGHLSVSIAQNMNRDTFCSTSSNQETSMAGNPEDEDDEIRPGSHSSPCSHGQSELDLFHDHDMVDTFDTFDMVDHYHGPSSLFVLCKRFRYRVLATRHSEYNTPLRDTLNNICEKAGVLEPFPHFGSKPVINIMSKQQANTVISGFFQRVNCATDVFVKSSLLAQVERIYSGSTEPGDDVLAICLQVITVLVWGTEISTKNGNGLFGDFARSFLPSRTALVNSSLLTTPTLINIQTLILLSVAAQQFDPPGWAEYIFSNACGLARTMGLQQTQLFPHETSTNEAFERAKVIQALYVRDKTLCTTRGVVSWLPTHDCGITQQLTAAMDRVAHSGALQLAMIQDQVYRLTHTSTSRIGVPIKSHTANAVRSIEHQLNEYERKFGVLNCHSSSYNFHRAMGALEFLTTRILALQYGSEQRHSEQVRLDGRTSCLLLLIAHGNQDREVLDSFNALACQASDYSDGNGDLSAIESSTDSFAGILDSFSVPAFFILLEDFLRDSSNKKCSDADLDLLRRVATCYTTSTERMQSNSYHRRVAWTFEQLLKINELINNIPVPNQSSPVATTDSMSQMMLSLDTQTQDDFDISLSHTMGDGSSLSFLSQLNTPFPWDMGSSISPSLGLHTPFGSAGLSDTLEAGTMDPFNQLIQGSPNSNSETSFRISEFPPEQSITIKRPRTFHELEVSAEDRPIYMQQGREFSHGGG